MTYAISSAEPSELFAYNVKGRVLDASLVVHSGVLRATLQFFEATCRESSFRMQVSHTADWMISHAHDSERVDDWVGKVGAGFLIVDAAIGMVHVAFWMRDYLIDTTNWIAGKIEDVKDAAVVVAIKLQRGFTAAAQNVLILSKLTVMIVVDAVGQTQLVEVGRPNWARIIMLPLVIIDHAKSSFAPKAPVVQVGNDTEFTYPRNAAEWFDKINAVPKDAPIQIINMGNNRYMVLIKGTPELLDPRGWEGGSNLWLTNFYSGLGFASIYSRRVQQVIESQVPKGATLYIAGHSQGGHAAQLVANTYAASGDYNVGAMYSYGANLITAPHSKIGDAKAFLFTNDPLNLIDKILDPTSKYQEIILDDSGTLNPGNAHGSYGKSSKLKEIGLPFDPPEQCGVARNFDAPEQPPVTDAITDGKEWAGDTVQSTVDSLGDLSSEIADSVSENYTYISDQIVTDGQHIGNTLQDFGDMVTSTVDDLGVL